MVAGGPGLTRKNQTVSQVVCFQEVARRHDGLARDDGGHTRTAAALAARVGRVNARIEQQVDQSLTAWPTQTMSLTIQLHFDMRNFRHEPMVCDMRRGAGAHARWTGKLGRSVR